MTLTQFRTIFSSELSNLYSSGEIQTLFFIVCEHFLPYSKVELRTNASREFSNEQSRHLILALDQLKTGIPYQHVLGETEFYGQTFFVNHHVLIPRPETEELLELAIGKIKDFQGTNQRLKILDIGTGSGVIPIVLKKHFPEAEITAIDFSAEALAVASRNAKKHSTDIRFNHQDYLSNKLSETYHVIISNPPYIGIDEEVEIEYSVKSYEPHMALFSPTSNALVFYEKIAADCQRHLAKDGLLFVEINQKLGPETLHLFAKVLDSAELVRDISGNDRFVWGRK